MMKSLLLILLVCSYLFSDGQYSTHRIYNYGENYQDTVLRKDGTDSLFRLFEGAYIPAGIIRTKVFVSATEVANLSTILSSQPIPTATQNALNLKQDILGFTPYNATNPNGYITSADIAGKANLVSPSFTTPNIGSATGTSLAVTGNITSSGGSIGYATGAGGAVTQTGNRSTGVTINKISGAITTVNTSLAAGAEASFTVTNSTVAIGDVVLVSARSGQTTGTSIPFVTAVANGSFQITLSNFNASTADTGAMVINFVVIKSVSQ